jgi:hypothetical protein
MSSEAIPLSKITAARKVEVVIVFSDLSDLKAAAAAPVRAAAALVRSRKCRARGP